jgi:protein-L-isoaspartate(D-aspartate) O-methyltransferase
MSARPPSPLIDPQAERHEMVRRQIEARGIRDPRVLSALRTVPRHEFVPPEIEAYAYEDRPHSIGWDQTISQPYIVALMTELCGLTGGETVLEVGTGSGYQAAVLAEIAARVYTVEIVEPLLRRAADTLHRLAYANVVPRYDDGGFGWPEVGPFDAILVTAAPRARVPQPLLDQLAEGGRLVAPVGAFNQRLQVHTRTEGGIVSEKGASVRFVPLTGRSER